MLVTGLVGIGGEHTGWGLEPDDKSATVELNVSAVFDTAKDLAGSHVTAKGHYIEKKYVERGKTRIFVVTSIARADR